MDEETKRRVDEMWSRLGLADDETREPARTAHPPHRNRRPDLRWRVAFVRYVNFVKLPHTCSPCRSRSSACSRHSCAPGDAEHVVLRVVVAFSAARFAAMGFNRIVDRDFDARNPRTMARELPRGAITLGQAWASVLAASAIFILAAGR